MIPYCPVQSCSGDNYSTVSVRTVCTFVQYLELELDVDNVDKIKRYFMIIDIMFTGLRDLSARSMSQSYSILFVQRLTVLSSITRAKFGDFGHR